MSVRALMKFFSRSNRQYPVYVSGVDGIPGPTGPAGPAGANGTNGTNGVGVLNYTTSEQDTGRTWTDGKTIYQKTIHFNAGPNDSAVPANHGITGLSNVIGFQGCMRDSTPIYRMIPNIEAIATQQCQIAVTATQVILASGTGGDYSGFSCDVTIWYTK